MKNLKSTQSVRYEEEMRSIYLGSLASSQFAEDGSYGLPLCIAYGSQAIASQCTKHHSWDICNDETKTASASRANPIPEWYAPLNLWPQ